MMMKRLGQFFGFIVAMQLSPTPILLKTILAPYFDLSKALTDPMLMLAEIDRFQAFAELYPTVVLSQLVPKMILLLIVSSLLITGCTRLFGFLTERLGERLRMRARLSATDS